MTVKKWLLGYVIAVLSALAVLAIMNMVIDPFGVFGDRFLRWYSYDMTQNPRVAKIAWLDQNHRNYDSYILGSSKASSLRVDTLNEYTGNRYYNMTWYGGDLLDEVQLAHYLIEHYEVKNIILTIDPQCAVYYNTGTQEDLKTAMHGKVNGESPLMFYSRYLLANPAYSWDKLSSYFKAGYLPDPSCVYVPETGCYNKTRRDASPINDMTSYLAYEKMYTYVEPCPMPYIDEAIAAIEEIYQLCQANGINFMMVGVPISEKEFASYPRSEVEEFWTRAAQITDFHAFWGYNSINADLRYYYDTMHFRNDVGDMVLATLFDDTSAFIPDDFGLYTTAENVGDVIAAAYENTDKPDLTADVVVLMYHSFTENESEATGTRVLISTFEEQLQALSAAGYTSVTYQQLIDFVVNGIDLPENSVVISIDDGYQDNLDLAAPLLKQYGFSANIAVIGVSVGHQTYKDTDTPIIPHFTLEDALAFVADGTLAITTHSYDMHQVTTLDGEDCRQGVLQLEGESELEYIAALTQDYLAAQDQLSAVLGEIPPVYTYPYGYLSELSEVVLHKLGIQVTVTTTHGANQLLKGMPQSLYSLRRINVEGGLNAEGLLWRMDTAIQTLYN